ncbi:MAG: efflux transporter outer membrane subunit [Phycisphaeraceae bacterium]|nr:MAG: efflux transporter outer membrane subunit [Phycisphaeraceae bacterium]
MTKSNAAMSVLLAAGMTTIPACTVGPEYARPEVSSPESFGSSEGVRTVTRPGSPAELSRWWDRFNDPVLSSLIDDAVRENLDLKASLARVAEARALRGVASSEQWPTLDALASFARSRRSETTPQGRFGGSDVDDSYTAGIDASWELDLWGRVRRGVEAADAEVAAAEEAALDAKVILAAEVASAYAGLRASQQRLVVARDAVSIREESLRLARARAEAGLTAELDVAQARAELATRRANIPVFEAQEAQASHRLAVLLAAHPRSLRERLGGAGPIPTPPEAIETGLPSELLLRRPDLRRAERQLAASSARIGVVTADLYPRVTLGASVGVEAANPGDLYDADSRYFSFGPSVRWNVFDAGRTRANIDAADARMEQALLAYRSAVLSAFAETEDAIADLVHQQRRADELAQAAEADRRAVELADALYRPGLRDLSYVLDNQRRLYESQDQLVLAKLQYTTAAIALYKSLGGGWEPPTTPPTPTPTTSTTADTAAPGVASGSSAGVARAMGPAGER